MEADGKLSAPPSPRSGPRIVVSQPPEGLLGSHLTDGPQTLEDDQRSTDSVIILDDAEERYNMDLTFPHTSYLSMFSPRFLVRSLYTAVMSLRFAFLRG